MTKAHDPVADPANRIKPIRETEIGQFQKRHAEFGVGNTQVSILGGNFVADTAEASLTEP
jgi:hypothetical protein